MYTYFYRDLKDYEQLKAALICTNSQNRALINYDIINTITLDDRKFDEFLSNFRTNQKFLYPYIEQMRPSMTGSLQCVLITNKKYPIKILAYNNGNSYPKYIGFIY